MTFETSALLVTWVAIVLLAFVVAALVRQVHALASGRGNSRSNEIGLQAGKSAPDFVRLAGIGHTGGLLLLFLSDSCGICDDVLDEVVTATKGSRPSNFGIRVLFPTTPRPSTAAGKVSSTTSVPVFSGETRLFEEYRVPATPLAVTVNAAGRVVRSEPIGSRRTFQQLIEQVSSSDTSEVSNAIDNDGSRR